MKFAFLCLDKKFVLQQPLENLLDMEPMGLKGIGKNLNIIKVNKHKNIKKIAQDIVDQGLKDSWCV